MLDENSEALSLATPISPCSSIRLVQTFRIDCDIAGTRPPISGCVPADPATKMQADPRCQSAPEWLDDTRGHCTPNTRRRRSLTHFTPVATGGDRRRVDPAA